MDVDVVVGADDVVVDEDDEDRLHRDAMRGKAFNLKRLIKVLHISEPVYHVLCLLGKKYEKDNHLKLI
jgi:hypothetical protein